MNWDVVGAIGELIGALAVILTLFYLASQIRQNTQMMRSTVREQRTASTQKALSEFLLHADILIKAMSGVELEGTDAVRFHLVVTLMIRDFETYYYQHSQGLFDESEWLGVKVTIHRRISSPHIQKVWLETQDEYSDKFQQFLGSLFEASA